MIINDWLLQEFRERVSRKRRLTMTDRLAEGLRAAGIKVSKDEEAEEQQFLDNSRSIGSPIGGPSREAGSAALGVA